MRELNELLYNTVRGSADYKTQTGATVTDPRFYKEKTPVRLPFNTSKPAYAVYHFGGGARPADIGDQGWQRNDVFYTLEIYCIDSTIPSVISKIIYDLFHEKSFETNSFLIGFTTCVEGGQSFDEPRQAYLQTVTVSMMKIFNKV